MPALATLRPAAPATVPHGSFTLWIVAAIVLGLVVAGGLVLASRR